MKNTIGCWLMMGKDGRYVSRNYYYYYCCWDGILKWEIGFRSQEKGALDVNVLSNSNIWCNITWYTICPFQAYVSILLGIVGGKDRWDWRGDENAMDVYYLDVVFEFFLFGSKDMLFGMDHVHKKFIRWCGYVSLTGQANEIAIDIIDFGESFGFHILYSRAIVTSGSL